MDKMNNQTPGAPDPEARATMISTATELALEASQQNRRLLANEIVSKIGLPPIKGPSGPRLFY